MRKIIFAFAIFLFGLLAIYGQTQNRIFATSTGDSDFEPGQNADGNANGNYSTKGSFISSSSTSGNTIVTSPTFAKLFNDNDSNHKYWVSYDIIQSSVDSGYIGVGWYQTIPNNNTTIQYFKLDKNGNIVWVRELPEYYGANILKIIKSQNGYLLSLSYNQSAVMEIDEQGNKLWAKSFNSPFANFIKVTSGGYVSASGNCNNCMNLIKIDNSGNSVWQKQFVYSLHTSNPISIRGIVQDGSGNFYIYGNIGDATVNPPWNSYDGLIIKIDANGNHLWTKYYASGTNTEDQITSAAVDNNSDIVFTGFSSGNNVRTGFIGKTNSSGTVLSAKQFPAEYVAMIFNTSSNNYDMLVYGYPSNIIGIATLNSSFGITTQKQFNFKSVYSVKSTLDNKFVVCGQYPFDTGSGDYRYTVFKVSYTNNSCIDTSASSFSLSNLSLSLSTLSPTTSTPSITLSNFAINPTVSALTDTSLCNQCNLTANVTSNGTTSFCSGGSVTLSANSGMTSYLWSNGQTTQTINVSQAGNYSVTITDINGCSATSTAISITVNPNPPIPLIQQSSNILFSSSATGNQWYLNANLIAGATGQVYFPTVDGNYTVCVTDVNGCSSCSTPHSFTLISVTEDEQVPMQFSLSQNFPNPFNASTVIRYDLPIDGIVSLKVYDLFGGEVKTLVYGNKSAGSHHIEFNASNLTSGTYFYRLTTENFTESKKFILMK